MIINSPWKTIQDSKYFALDENWGDPNKVDSSLVLSLDNFRGKIDVPVHISPKPGAVYAADGHDAPQSWHYIIPGRNEYAMAADIFPECNIGESWWIAINMRCFGGIGIYPWARYSINGKLLRGMLHLDLRPGQEKKLWWRDSLGNYNPIKSFDNFKYIMDMLENDLRSNN